VSFNFLNQMFFWLSHSMPCRDKNAEDTEVRNVGLMLIVLHGCDTTGAHVDGQAALKVASDAREADKSANSDQTYFKVLHDAVVDAA
jgi:hypothetical protein